jgi:hypothetical protein
MNVKLLFAASALAVGCAGWFAGAGASAGYASGIAGESVQAAAASQPELDTWSAKPSLGVRATTGVAVTIPAAATEVGKLTLYVPAGYALDPSASPGTREGFVVMATASDFAFGDLKAVNPAAYVNTPQAQACAPGAHTAVWIMDFEDGLFSPQTVTVPIYIDPTSGDEAALGAYKLQACLPLAHTGSPGGWPLGSKLRGLGLGFTRITNPTSAANYIWRAFVSNPDANGNPDPSTTYELRSDMPLPAKLSLIKRFVRKHHQAVLSGRLATPAAPIGGITVTLYRHAFFGWKSVATTRTLTDGSYRFSRPIAKPGTYAVETGAIGTCNGISTAPNGCLSETRAAIDSRNVRVVFRSRR